MGRAELVGAAGDCVTLVEKFPWIRYSYIELPFSLKAWASWWRTVDSLFIQEKLDLTINATQASNGVIDAKELIPQIRAEVTGQVITAEDKEYDEARKLFYGKHDKHPTVIVRATNATDVARVVTVARETGVELAVRGGGHSVAGLSVSEGGIVLDLSEMKGLDIDVEARDAWAEAGLTALEYTEAAAEYGLATGFGDTGTVGIGGLTLGGGIGFMVRKHGLTIDDLLAAEIVTADGKPLNVNAEENADLFWAIRGGGGNFGVVTRFKFRLHPVETIVGGMLILPGTPEVIAKFMDLADKAPEELSTIANIMVAPPMPFLPEEQHGKLVIMAMLAYVGDTEAGEKVIAPFRALGAIADMVKAMPYPEMYKLFPEGPGPTQESSRSLFRDTFNKKTAKMIVEHLQKSSAMFAVAQIRVLGGAMAKVPVEATAFAHRKRKYMAALGAIYENADEVPTHEAWVEAFAAAMAEGEPGVYVNFVGNEGEARVKDAYPNKTYDRLAEIKAKVDPGNVFRMNQNIKPKE